MLYVELPLNSNYGNFLTMKTFQAMFHSLRIQISQSELIMGKTLPETIVFKVRKLPYLEFNDNSKNAILFITHPLILICFSFCLTF